MAAARALALAAARRRVAPVATRCPAPAAPLLRPRLPPVAPAPAAAAALLEGPRALPPLVGGRPALAAALLHGPRALPPPLGARLLRLLPAMAPPPAAPGLRRLLSAGATVQPGRDEADRTADITRAYAVETGYAKGGEAAGVNKTSRVVVDKSGTHGVANSKVLSRDTKLAGGIRDEDDVLTAAKAAAGDVVQKAGALDLATPLLTRSGRGGANSKVRARDTKLAGEIRGGAEVPAAKATSGVVVQKAGTLGLAAPLLVPHSPQLLGARFACLRPLQPTTPLAAALGRLQFSTGAATTQSNGAGDTNSAGNKEANNAAADTTRADGEDIVGTAKTKPAAAGGNSDVPRDCSSNVKGAGKAILCESCHFDKIREMLEEFSKEERMSDTTHIIVLCLILLCEVVVVGTIAAIYAVMIFHEKMEEMILDAKNKKTRVEEEQQQQQVDQ